jgi:hypothetical protein
MGPRFHTPGHVAFFRHRDAALPAGNSVTAMSLVPVGWATAGAAADQRRKTA